MATGCSRDLATGGSLEELENLLRRSRDDRAIAPHDDGALHELRMFDEQPHDRFSGLVVRGVEAELLELPILANQGRGLVGEQIQEALDERGLQARFQVFDDVELDAAVAQDVQRTA